MNLRMLGNTGLTVSEIGFGTWGIGGSAEGDVAYGPTNDGDSIQALRRAFDLGVNFFDTSDLYGFGHSERLLADAFQGLRQKVIIASKVGFAKQNGSLGQDFSPQHIRSSLEQSLRRLRSDYIDLYQLHSPAIADLQQEPGILDLLYSFQKEGKIRAVGVSARSPEEALLAARDLKVRCVQVNFNLIDQRVVENGFMTYCEREGVGFIGRTPLCFGFLGGGYSSQTKFDSLDHRSKWPAGQLDVWANAPQAFSSVLGKYSGQTPSQLALRYCLSYPGISTVIPGMLTAGHVNENTLASSLGPFTAEERSELEEIYKKHTFFLKREKKP